jgi:hypothetical protein
MKKLLFFGLLLLLLAACTQTQFAPPEKVDAQAKKESYRFSEHTAAAYFYSSDECSSTYVSVFATEQKSKAGGGTEPWAGAYVYHDNWCTDTYISAYGSTSLATGAFTTSGGLKSATLKTAIEFFQERWYYDEDSGWWDYTYEFAGVLDVDLNWTGTGKTESYKSSNQYRSPDSKSHYRSKGTFRNASASGNVGVSLNEVNTTFNSSDYAWIGKSKSGSMYISK